jgi:hypothetical protein
MNNCMSWDINQKLFNLGLSENGGLWSSNDKEHDDNHCISAVPYFQTNPNAQTRQQTGCWWLITHTRHHVFGKQRLLVHCDANQL